MGHSITQTTAHTNTTVSNGKNCDAMQLEPSADDVNAPKATTQDADMLNDNTHGINSGQYAGMNAHNNSTPSSCTS
eukprot:19772-Heterococcus_DN1.PRE.1